MPLVYRFSTTWDERPFIARLTRRCDYPAVLRSRHALLLTGSAEIAAADVEGFRAFIALPGFGAPPLNPIAVLSDSDVLPTDGDVLRIEPARGRITLLYRPSSTSNALFVTERCNSRCVMCSQPPRDRDDELLLQDALELVELIDRRTSQLGVTGGEPTLLGDGLVRLLRKIHSYLPATEIHLLSNGRLFQYLALAKGVATAAGANLLVGVPLYSDIAEDHNGVVQQEGAFDETVRGILNLHRCGVRVELRMVLHAKTVPRLREYARFVRDNLPFVNHIAFMGLEVTGYAKARASTLWVDPAEYGGVLGGAVRALARAGMNVSIFNLQRCVLDESLWQFCKASISDWKRGFLDACAPCTLKGECGGFFETDGLRHSANVHPITA